jgi:hypothetical protein
MQLKRRKSLYCIWLHSEVTNIRENNAGAAAHIDGSALMSISKMTCLQLHTCRICLCASRSSWHNTPITWC